MLMIFMQSQAELAGQVVAVKKLSPRSKQGVEEFRRELYTLKSLRHKNLVELFDGYSDHGYHLLIYEYMENKSLADVLFGMPIFLFPSLYRSH